MTEKKNSAVQVFVPVTVAVGGGILLGGCAFLLAKVLPLLLIIPIIVGVAIGFVLKKIFEGSVVSSVFTITTVVLMTVVSVGTKNFAEYQSFKKNISEHLLPESIPNFLSKIVETVATPFVDDFLEMKTGHSGFAGYMIFSAEQPIPAGFGKVLDFGAPFGWILRILELTLTIAIAVFIVRKKRETKESA